MTYVPFEISNNWDDFPELKRAFDWKTTESNNDPCMIFETSTSGRNFQIRMNDFPDEPLHTLLIDGEEVIHFDTWPDFLGSKPGRH